MCALAMRMPYLEPERAPESDEIRNLRREAVFENPEGCYRLGLALKATGTAEGMSEALQFFAAAGMSDHPGGYFEMALHYRRMGDLQLACYHLEASAFQHFEPAVQLLREWKRA